MKGWLQKVPFFGAMMKSGDGMAGWADLLNAGGSNVAADLTQPYRNSVWVSRAIKHISGPISMVPIKFTLDRQGGDVAYDDQALTKFWQRPAKSRGGLMNFSDFIEASVTWLKLKGECFWILDDTWLQRGSVTRSPIILARPDEMTPVQDSRTRELIGWLWTDPRGGKAQLIAEQVRHIKYFNPYDDVRGLAEWEAARIASDSDYAAGVFARNLSKNNGDRGPYIIGKDGTISDEQLKQITAQLRNKREMSRRGDFRAVFLTGDIELKEPSMQSVDAAYVAQRLENRHEIYTAFGVPMSFCEVMASYSVGSASDRFRLLEDTCIPTGSKLADEIEQVSMLLVGDRKTLFAAFDWTQHSTMQAVRRETLDSLGKLTDKGMPVRAAGEYLGLALPRYRGDEIGRVPFNLQEIGGDEPTEDKPVPAPEEDPVKSLEGLFTRRAASKRSPHVDPRQRALAPAGLWAKIHKAREPWETKFASKISRYLMDARSETLRKLSALEGATKGAETKSLDVLSILFDLNSWLDGWSKGLAGVSRAALDRAGFELWTDELGRDDALTLPAADVLTALAQRENKLRDAGTKIWEAVRDDLSDGITKGETIDQLAGRVRSKFKGIEASRSKVIAITETTVAYECGRDMTFRAAGVRWTQWLHSGLVEHARLNHQAADGQIRELGEKFDVGSAQLAYPGDPDAPASEVIGCKCVRIAVAGPDGDDIEGNDNDEIPY